MFQSAPHFSSEANASDKHFPGDLGPFQSAPHFSSEANLARQIKIEGGFDAFQSAPHFSSEANRGNRANCARRRCFNPRLTSAARRTSVGRCGQFLGAVSIRASLQQRGERRPHRNRGPLWRRFQSAPHFSSEANAPLGHD